MTKHVEVHISSLLTDEEWNILRLFCDKARRLGHTKLGSGQFGGIKGKIRYERDKGLWFESELPSEELIAEFLMGFRFFYLQKEPTHFPKVIGLIRKHANNEDARKALKVFSKQWNDCLFGKALNISYNDKQMTSSLLLDLWFNAHYFHQDAEKGTELNQLILGFSENFAKFMLMDATFEATKVVYRVFNGLRGVVDEHFANKE